MRKLSVPVLLAIAAGIGVASWAVVEVLMDRGAALLSVPWTVPAVLVAVAVAVLALGRRVRQFKAGDRPNLDPIEAARTAVFAQAAAYSGAAFVGAYAGYAVALGSAWGHEPRREVVISAAVAGLAALALTVAGGVAERWCMSNGGPGDDKGLPGDGAAAGAG